jgi:hypothetical protein
MEYSFLEGKRGKCFQELDKLRQEYEIKIISIGYYFNNNVEINFFKIKRNKK